MILKKTTQHHHFFGCLLWLFFWLLQMFFSLSVDMFFAPHLWDAGSLQLKTCRNWPGKTVDFSAFTPMFWGSCFLRKKVHPHVPSCFGSGKYAERKAASWDQFPCHFNENEMNTYGVWSFTYHMKGADTNSQNCWKILSIPTCVALRSWTSMPFIFWLPPPKKDSTHHSSTCLVEFVDSKVPQKNGWAWRCDACVLFKSWEFIPIGMSFQYISACCFIFYGLH